MTFALFRYCNALLKSQNLSLSEGIGFYLYAIDFSQMRPGNNKQVISILFNWDI